MNTPILDFLEDYNKKQGIRFHMPGHKGQAFLGCEGIDLTEIKGADELYEAEGIIAESEANASKLFGTAKTFYSTEGSSQCVRGMISMAISYCLERHQGRRPVIYAARNVHKAFVYAVALLDVDVEWLWPGHVTESICNCPISIKELEERLNHETRPVVGVYVTSPDYLGGISDIQGISEVCHAYNTLLLVDNAHGAYLHFLPNPIHPMDLGADLCCDSAHKTLPALTGAAYLHVSKRADEELIRFGREALAMFGSTSPSYLIMASLDRCNRYLADDYKRKLQDTIAIVSRCKVKLREQGWNILPSDPLRITIKAPEGITGIQLAQWIRKREIECEFCDPGYLVLMVTPENPPRDYEVFIDCLGAMHETLDTIKRNAKTEHEQSTAYTIGEALPKPEVACSIRTAVLMPHEMVPVSEALGRICAMPAVSCPPAIPIVLSGERIGEQEVELFKYYGFGRVSVLK